MTTKILTVEESADWQRKIKDTVSAEPLSFEKATEANAPFHLEVTNGQAPGGGRTLVIHVFKRADVDPQKAMEIVQHALVDVFGPDAGAQADCDYRDVGELKKRFGDQHLASETHDTMTVIFGPGPISRTRPRHWVRDQMAAALAKWWLNSHRW